MKGSSSSLVTLSLLVTLILLLFATIIQARQVIDIKQQQHIPQVSSSKNPDLLIDIGDILRWLLGPKSSPPPAGQPVDPIPPPSPPPQLAGSPPVDPIPSVPLGPHPDRCWASLVNVKDDPDCIDNILFDSHNDFEPARKISPACCDGIRNIGYDCVEYTLGKNDTQHFFDQAFKKYCSTNSPPESPHVDPNPKVQPPPPPPPESPYVDPNPKVQQPPSPPEWTPPCWWPLNDIRNCDILDDTFTYSSLACCAGIDLIGYSCVEQTLGKKKTIHFYDKIYNQYCTSTSPSPPKSESGGGPIPKVPLGPDPKDCWTPLLDIVDCVGNILFDTVDVSDFEEYKKISPSCCAGIKKIGYDCLEYNLGKDRTEIFANNAFKHYCSA